MEETYSKPDLECQVQVNLGKLQGKKAKTFNGLEYYSFEGIPYAKPPVGKLRFRAPQPAEPWDGIRDATKPGPKCAQMDHYSPKPVFTGSEDCLYLNVYTPTLKKTDKTVNLPVIFFVHGGRYLVGYGDYYKPDFFLNQNCIVVTVNFRLHVLGFLCLETAEIPGNASLKDAVLALKWVKENISYFNGDSDNITAFGESAGSGTVGAFLGSEMTNGLFHKAIKISGSFLADLFMQNEDVVGKAGMVCKLLGKETKDKNEMLDILEKASVEDLVKIVGILERSREQVNAYFLPVIEKKFPNTQAFLCTDPWKDFIEGRLKKMPILTGLMSQEGAYFLERDPKGNLKYKQDLQFFIPTYMNLKKDSQESKRFAENLKKYYFGNKFIDDNLKEQYVNFVSDAYFIRDLSITFDYLAQTNPELYLFLFSYTGNLNTRIMKSLGLPGASHSDVLPYLFYRHNKMDKCSQKDWEVIQFFSESICNFAKTGKPTSSINTGEWLPYNKNKRFCIEISDTIKYTPYRFANRVDVWKKLMYDKCKL